MEEISLSFNHPITKGAGRVDASLQSDEQTEQSSPVIIIESENCNSDVMSTQHSVASSAHSDDSKGSQNDDNNIFEEVNALSKKVCNMDKTENDNTTSRFNQPHEWVKKVVNKNCPINNSGRSEKFRLRISNMPVDWSPLEIQNFLFEEYCSVDVFYIATDKDLCFLGTVEVDFTSLDDCHAAYKKLNGKIVEDIKLFAEIKDSGGAVSDHSDEEAHPTSAKKRKLSHTEARRPVIDVWEVDPKGLFGLKTEFLETLGIKPPIGKWVHVTNFRCEKSELKEVLELAGQVKICSVDNRAPKYAKVMYSHPLEAVQAVSMLNNQDYYGLPLKVTIDSCLDSGPILPKGLEALGPGLGIDQKPLQDIVKQYERFVNYKSSLVNTAIFLNPDVLFGSNVDESQSHAPEQPNGAQTTARSWYQIGPTQSTLNQTPVENQNQTGYNTPTAPIQPASNFGPNVSGAAFCGPSPVPAQPTLGHSQMPSIPVPSMASQGSMAGQKPPISGQGQNVMGSQGYMARAGMVPMNFRGSMTGSGSMAGPDPMSNLRPMAHQRSMTGVGSMAGPDPMSNLRPMAHQRSMGNPSILTGFNVLRNAMNMARMMRAPVNTNGPRAANNNATVTLSNLPLSTTFPLLCEKMGQCGSVISIQLTSPGCAVVQFAQRAFAERCFQQYNNCNILGNVIKVMLC